jgi:2,3-bisphosphoglycerate-independent phosphoglycerate mutase
VKAVETIDASLGQLRDALTRVGGAMLITADHGNLEQMEDPKTHQPHTAHTTNLVPLVLVDCRADHPSLSLNNGRLADIAPTVLKLMAIAQPAEMTGHSLLTPAQSGANQAVLEEQGYHVAS